MSAENKQGKNFSVPLPSTVKVSVEEPVFQKDFRSFLTRAIAWAALTPLLMLAFVQANLQSSYSELEDHRQVEATNQIQQNLSTLFTKQRALLESTADALPFVFSKSEESVDESVVRWLVNKVQRDNQLQGIYLVRADGTVLYRSKDLLPWEQGSAPIGERDFEVQIYGQTPNREACFSVPIKYDLDGESYSLVACYSTAIFSDIFMRSIGVLPMWARLLDSSGKLIYQRSINGAEAEDFPSTSLTLSEIQMNLKDQNRLLWRTDQTRDKSNIVSAVRIPETEWYLTVSQPVTIRDERMRSSLVTSGILLLIGALGTIIIGWVLSRELTSSMLTLEEMVQQFKKKGKIDTDLRVSPDAPTEFLLFEKELRHMAKSVSHSKDILKNVNIELQKQVTLRTATLNSRNEELDTLQRLLTPIRLPISELFNETLEQFRNLLQLRSLDYDPDGKVLQGIKIPVMASGDRSYGNLIVSAEEKLNSTQLAALVRLANSVAIVMDNRSLFTTIEQSHSRFTVLMDSMTDGIVLIGKSGSLLYANQAAKSMLQIRGDESIKDVFAFIDSKFREVHLEGTAFGEIEDKKRWISKLDSDFCMETSHFIVPEFMGYSGERKGLVLRDISDETRIERLKQNLLSIVAHELKTPVTTMRLQAQTLQRMSGAGEPSENTEVIAEMLEESERLETLIRDWLDISRIESGEMKLRPTIVMIRSLVSEAMKSVGVRFPELQVTVELEEGAEYFLADKSRVLQVIINLLENAARYRSEEPPVCRITSRNLGNEVEISFSDNGIGIPEAKLDKIFDMFYQVDMSLSRKVGGTGLGLAICRGIIAAHGGRIWAQSVLGKGSVFKFTIAH